MIYLIENSYFALLTAVYKFYTEKPSSVNVLHNFSQLSFIDDVVVVETNEVNAKRIDNNLPDLD